MLVLRSRWILPIADRPLLNGWIALDRGRVAAIGRAGAALPFKGDAPLVDLGDMAILPALANAHTHLELSWLQGRVGRAKRFTDWVREQLGLRRTAPPSRDDIAASIRTAIAQAHATGTGFVGDVSNTLASVDLLRGSPLKGVVFHELLRLRAADADAVLEQGLKALDNFGPSSRVALSLAPHAPYSVSPLLFQGIKSAVARLPMVPSTVHLGESPEEVQFLKTGDGPWRQLLQDLAAWDPSWQAPNCSPVEYLARMKILGPRLLVVHGTQFTDADLASLKQWGAILVTCPRSNQYVGVGEPPVSRFYKSGVTIAIGTDSLASNDDLNMFSELAELRRLAPDVRASSLLWSATRGGARALGFDAEAGTIEPGRGKGLIAVDLPADLVDVEEYLVSGVPADRVHWVDTMLGPHLRYA
jgi:aminodeoxyfutalosine deaminase